MNLENPSSIISSATNAVAQITSLAAEKLGPITTKTVEVVSRQVVVEAVTLLFAVILSGILAAVFLKLGLRFDAKVTSSSSRKDDEANAFISYGVSLVCIAIFVGTLIASIVNVPTAIFNTEYAAAEKFVEIFKQLKP